MKNRDVVMSWLNGERAQINNLRSDGNSLFSYNLKIGERDPYSVRVYDYTASGSFISVTTSKHVGLALRLAGTAQLVTP
jgi:hypothetical protein